MIFTQEMARARQRDNLALAQDLRVAGQLRSLARVRRNADKAERRLVQAWRARADAEDALAAG